MLLSAPRLARAISGDHFFETIGISVAVGTVLGASTLPFYSQPGTQLINLVYSASIEAVTGLGMWLYGVIAGPPQKRSSDARIALGRSGLRMFVYGQSSFFTQADCTYTRLILAPESNRFAHPALISMPLVSLTW